jgi:hypothetical protein
MPKDNNTAKLSMKVVAIAASAVLVAALAATGVLAYAQNNTGSNTTMFGETNATDTASTSNMTETSASQNATEASEETFTASAEPNSECSTVYTPEGSVSLNSTVTMTAEEVSEEAETMTAGLNDTHVATLDELIENACDAIRDGKSVTALGFLSTARDVLSEASETETTDEGEVEDEPVDLEDLEAEDLEAGGNETGGNNTGIQ